jgi:hypothetical protein
MSARTSKNPHGLWSIANHPARIVSAITVRGAAVAYVRNIMLETEKCSRHSDVPLAFQLRWHRRIAYFLIAASILVLRHI